MIGVIVGIAAAIYFQINLLILLKLDEIVPKPYMDEIFHVPQAQQYCLGNYQEWNEKITTLPGLYLLSTSFYRLLTRAVGLEDESLRFCTTFYLRLFNVFLSTLNFLLVYKILRFQNTKTTKKTQFEKNHNSISNGVVLSLLGAFGICLFPLNYFFQFLYYTDVGSTFFVLLAYYNQLRARYALSALSGGAAILFRQTNIVWLLFCLALTILKNCESLLNNADLKKSVIQKNETSYLLTNQRKKRSNIIELITKTPQDAFFSNIDFFQLVHKLYREDFWGKKLLYADLYYLLDFFVYRPFLIVILAFVSFIYVNDGIVVGDRSNHQATFHLTQLFYFFTFSTFFSFSSFIFNWKKIKSLLTFLTNNFKLVAFLVLPIFLLIVSNFTFEHPFLLADNRHFTFYIWSRVFKRHAFLPFALTPVYLISTCLFFKNLASQQKSVGWLAAFSVCLCASIVPQKLLEFRYFILPFLIYRLNLAQYSLKESICEILFNLSINVVTLYLFLSRTFYWANAPNEPQRFMW